jgi:hypothetical protein
VKAFGRQLTPPLDFRFLDLFVVLLLSVGGFAIMAIVLGIGGRFNNPLEIASHLIPDAGLMHVYSYERLARGGRPPYEWKSNGLPPGIQIDQQGILHGTPQSVGEFRVSIAVLDSRATTVRREFLFSVTDQGHLSPLHIRTTKLPVGHVGSPFDLAIAVDGGVLPYRWAATGLAHGTDFVDGAITGGPTEASVYAVHLEVRDSAGQLALKDFNWQVLAAELGDSQMSRVPLRISTTLPPAIAETAYSIQLAAIGGNPPYQWQLNSRYPGTKVSLQGVLETDEPGQWADGSALSVRVFDRDGDSATAVLTPRVVRSNSLSRRALSVMAAVGAWGLLLLLLRRTLQPSHFQTAEVWRQPSGFVALSLLLVACSVAFDGSIGTLLFSFVAMGTATYILVKERQEHS